MTKNTVNEKISKLSADLGYVKADPDIVQPATAYFDLLGDGLRRRLYVVQNAMNASASQDFVLRPEFTICIAKDYIQSLAGGTVKVAKLAYSGPVFRSDDAHQCKQSIQSGIEIFAAEDSFKADIETIEYALRTIDELNINNVQLQMGDYELFFSLLDNLDISDIWRKKLKRLFLSHDNLADLLEALAKPQVAPVNNERAAFLNAIEGLEVNAAQMLVENVLSFSGIDLIGGRSAGEIAERFLEQAALSATPELPPEVLQILKVFFAINGKADQCLTDLTALNQKYKLKLDDQIKALSARFAAIDALNIKGFAKQDIMFNALLGRGFEYYTGMLFEIIDLKTRSDKPLIGGGRYDTLAKQLGAAQHINAVGASMWDAHLTELLEGESKNV